jgi:hypothetical protein
MYIPMLRDPYSSTVITTCCFQYQGRDVIAAIHSKFPNLRLYATELQCGGGDNTWAYAFNPTFLDVQYYVVNGASGAFQWNLILEKAGKAGYIWNWNQNSMITIDTVAKTYTCQSQYYVLKHFSYYIRPGSRLLRVTGNYAVNEVSVKNADGSLAIVTQNNSTGTQPVGIRFGNQMVTATLPASSFASFLIYDSSANSIQRPAGNFVSEQQVKIRVTGTENGISINPQGCAYELKVIGIDGSIKATVSSMRNGTDMIKVQDMAPGIYFLNGVVDGKKYVSSVLVP